MRPSTRSVQRASRALVRLVLAIAAIMAASVPAQADTLQAGDNLYPDASVWSSDGRYHLRYQSDGNLVLYKVNGTVLWATYAFGAPGVVRMQGDGNFVVYDAAETPVWDSNTDGNPGAFLEVQNDGNVVIYRADGVALWATGTVQPPDPGQPEFATFIHPTNGDPAANLTQPFRWTTVNGAQAYYLYVGTEPGANNLVNTGEIQQTSFLAPSLPTGETLYATIWTKYSGIWYASYISFTAATSPWPATFVAPSNGMSNVDLSQPFQWTAVSGAEAYYLYVGTGVGLQNLVDTGEIQQTSYTATNLPSSQTLYARIWTKLSGIWYSSDISFSGAVRATLTYPENASTNADLSQAFQWTTVSGAEAYYLYVGTGVGLKDLVDTGEIQQTSYRASGLPSNQTLYARIWTKTVGTWYYADSASSGVDRATFISPTAGATNADLIAPIQWTSVAGAQAYYLYVGTAVGLKDLVDTGEIQQMSFVATSLPSNQALYARIWTKVSGTWYYADISFSGIRTAVFVSPANGATNVDLLQPLQWTTVNGAEAYYLYVGTAVGLKDLVDTGEIQQTSYAATSLPANQTLYARISTKLSGTWYYSDISFSGFRKAMFTFPTNGATNVNPTSPIQWTSVAEAQAYYLYVGTAVGLKDLVDTGEIQQTSYTASNLPAGLTLYARIWTKLSGAWFFSDITFSRAPLTATFISPTNGASNVGLPLTFQWTAVSGAQAYYLYVGREVGLKDLVDTGEIQQTSYTALNLPPNETVYARIHTNLGGQWYYSDIAFSVMDSDDCTYSVSRTNFLFRPSGGRGEVAVWAPNGCQWSVDNQTGFIQVTSPSSGSGSGVVSFDVENAGSSEIRTGDLMIAGHSITIVQGDTSGGFACEPSVSPEHLHFEQSGGTLMVALTAAAGCEWSVASELAWLTFGPDTGTGSAQIAVTASANGTSDGRGGLVFVNGSPISVLQDGTSSVMTLETFVPQQQSQLGIFSGGELVCTQTISSGNLNRWIAASMDMYLDGQKLRGMVGFGPVIALEVRQYIPSSQNVRTSHCVTRLVPSGELIDEASITIPAAPPPPPPTNSCNVPVINKKGFRPSTTVTYSFGGRWGIELVCVLDALDEWSRANVGTGLDVTFIPAPRGASSTLKLVKAPLTGNQAGGTSDIQTDAGGFIFTGAAVFTTNTNLLRACVGFRKVALHEVGHFLGLQDNTGGTNQTSVMNVFTTKDDGTNNLPQVPQSCDASQAYWAKEFGN